MIGRIFALLLGYLIGNIRGRLFCKCFIADIFDMAKAIIPIILIVYEYWYVLRGTYGDFVFILYYLELGIVLGHNFPFFLRDKRDNCIAVYWGIILLFNYYNRWLTFFCLVAYLGELYVTGNRKRATVKLILVYTIGFVIGSYFGGYYDDIARILIEFNIITMIISYVTHVSYKAEIRVKGKE